MLASVLLLDLELTHLPRDTLKRFTDSNQQFAAFLAAGYNRNPVRVIQTYHRTRTLTGGDTPFENKMYVRIQSWIGGFRNGDIVPTAQSFSQELGQYPDFQTPNW